MQINKIGEAELSDMIRQMELKTTVNYTYIFYQPVDITPKLTTD